MYESADLDIREPTLKLRKFPASHLTSPLTYYPQRILLQGIRDGIKDSEFFNVRVGIKAVVALRKIYKHMEFTVEPDYVYHQVFSSAYNHALYQNMSNLEKGFNNLLTHSINDMKTTMRSIGKHSPALSDLKLQLDSSSVERGVTKLCPAYTSYRMLSKMRSAIQVSHVQDNQSLSDKFVVGGLTFHYAGELVFCVYGSGPTKCCILNYDQLIMLVDTLSARLLSLITVVLNDIRQYDVLPSYNLLLSIYKWGDEMIKKEGMKAYSVIGEYESIVTACFVTFGETDVLELGQTFFDSVIESARENDQEYGISVDYTVKLLSRLKEVNSVNVLSELFGIRKHWGNPMVDAAASGRAVQEKITENLPLNAVALMNLQASFNRMITLEYIKKHHVWPKCKFFPVGDKVCPIRDAWKSGSTRIPEKSPHHDHLHWGLMRFENNCTVQEYKNQLATLSDKAVSLPLDELDSVYFGKKDKKGSGHQRRLILEYLRTDHLTVKEILQAIMCGNIPDNWLANTSSMKGTEVKHLKARIFAVLTFEMRQYFSITEDMIKENIFPYNPHQTMTMSEGKLLSRLREITKQMDTGSVERTLNLIHIIDFSKWNLRMRYANTALVFKSIDDFMGTPGLIEQSHTLFESMINIVNDPYNAPDCPVREACNDTIWTLHTKGWEGQRQKGWTAMTSALLSDLERKTGVKSIICGQGDNQVLLTHFPIPSEFKNAEDWVTHQPTHVREILDAYYQKLEISCSDVGLKVKTAESCRSLHYLNYGKRLYFNGCELSMSLKRISKILTEPNDAFPTSESRLKTAQGASYAANLYSNPSPWVMLMGKFATNLLLWESFTSNPLIGDFGVREYSKYGIMTPRFVSILSKIPHSLGGPPQQSMASYFCRGHPDPLCEDLVGLTLAARQGCITSRSIIKIARSGKWFREHAEDKSSLIVAPYSLNMDLPSSSTSPLAKSVLPALRDACNNKSVQEILDLEVGTYEEDLYKSLSNITPFNPLVANDIFSRSIPGKRQNFVNGLKNSTSLCRLVQESSKNSLLNEIMKLERDQLQFWINQVESVCNMKDPRHKDILHHVLAQELRDMSWRTEIVGVTVPHPLELFTIVRAEEDDCSNHNPQNNEEHLVVVRHSDKLFSPAGADSTKVQLTRSRTGVPYVGNTISEGLFSKQVICKSLSEAWEDACRLNVLRRWIAEPGSKMDLLIRKIIATRTDASLELLDLVTGFPCRDSYSHRANLMAVRKSCAITTTSNMLTRLYISSNRMGEFSSGDWNYHLPYGPSFITISTLLCMAGVMSEDNKWDADESAIYHCHLNFRDIPIVYDGSIECELDDLAMLSQPPAQLFSSVDEMVFEDMTVRCHSYYNRHFNEASIGEANIAYGYLLLGDSLVREISSKELEASSLITNFTARSSTLTTNDIKLTGVIGLVRAISTMLLINCSVDVIYSSSDEQFIVGMRLLCDNLSDYFWGQFASVMIHKGVLAKLKELAGGVSYGYNTADIFSISDTLKAAVCIDAKKILNILRVGSPRAMNNLLVLAVPNDNAARHLLGRFYRVFIWTVCCVSGIQKYHSLTMSKETLEDLYDPKKCPTITSARIYLTEQLARVKSGFAGGLRTCSLPAVRVLNLNEPWVNKLKPTLKEFVEKRSEIGLYVRKARPNVAEFVSVRVGSEEIKVEHTLCRCTFKKMYRSPYIDFFYLRAGRMNSYSPLIIDTIEMAFLDSRSVMVIGDTDGDLGLAIARLTATETVYIAPTRSTTAFSQHAGGNCIPTAFYEYGLTSKLVDPEFTNLIGDPLISRQSTRRVAYQARKGGYTGVVINYTQSDRKEQLAEGRLHSLLVELISCSIKNEWCLIITKAPCVHHLHKIISLLGSLYDIVSVCKSWLHRPSINIILIVGRHRRVPSLNLSDNEVFLNISTSIDIARVITTDDRDVIPPLMSQSPNIQREWLAVFEGMPSNFRELCNCYIPGWGSTHCEVPTVHDILLDLRDIKEQVKLEAEHNIKVQESAAEGGALSRNEILALKNPSTGSHLMVITHVWIRCLILERLLTSERGNLSVLLEDYDDMMKRDYVIVLADNAIHLPFSVAYFRRYYSSSLFGIIGHVWDTIDVAVRSDYKDMLHLKRTVQYQVVTFPIPMLLERTFDVQEKPNNRYRWDSRAKMVAIMYLSAMFNQVLIVSKNMEVLRSRLIQMIKSRGEIHEIDLDDGGPVLLWLADWADDDHHHQIVMESLDRYTEKVHFAVISVKEIGLFSFHFDVHSAEIVAWSGEIPSLLLVNFGFVCSKATALRYGENFKYTTAVNHITDRITHSGCLCHDCDFETVVSEKLKLSMADVTEMCRVYKYESIDDIRHVSSRRVC